MADRGYYASEEIRACEEAGIAVTLPTHIHVCLKQAAQERYAAGEPVNLERLSNSGRSDLRAALNFGNSATTLQLPPLR